MAAKKAKKARSKKWEKELRESAHKIWLAGLGAFATAEEEGGRLFNQLVKRGETMEARGGKEFDKAREKVGSSVKGAGDKMETSVQDAREKVESGLKDARKKVSSTMKKAKKRVETRFDSVRKGFDGRLGDALNKLGVPTRDEIQTLTKRVEELNSKVDQLKGDGPKKKAKPAAKVSGRTPGKVIEVVSAGDGWTVKVDGSGKGAAFGTKREAVAAARKRGETEAPCEVIVYGRDGKVQTRHGIGETG